MKFDSTTRHDALQSNSRFTNVSPYNLNLNHNPTIDPAESLASKLDGLSLDLPLPTAFPASGSPTPLAVPNLAQLAPST
jgi:hypothetical protein